MRKDKRIQNSVIRAHVGIFLRACHGSRVKQGACSYFSKA